jgi:serine/threonine protein kinase
VNRLDSVVQTEAASGSCPRQFGAEPLPGYRLLERLGRGGFGEVWKCEVPGGLHKAIKFVEGNLHDLDSDSAPARQELEALQRVKAIRHPFILSIDRIEVLGGELLIVTELADKNLHQLLTECRDAGLPGIPRGELLRLLLEAAEALDWMNFQHGLQHLDVKPHNLFLVSHHVKVADFGLVNSFGESQAGAPGQRWAGGSPCYAAPEILNGGISRHSDQYSLAVVYQELLTGRLPFRGKNVRQLILQHQTAAPELDGLPEADRPLLARALARDPEQRFPSCLDFINALVPGQDAPPDPAGDQAPGRSPAGRSGMPGCSLSGFPRVPLSARPTNSTANPAEPGPVPEPTPATEHFSGVETVPGPQPGSALLPGHRFLDCLGQGPLAETWQVQAPDGRRRLAQLLPGLVGADPPAAQRLVARLNALAHPHLVPREVVRGATGRVLVLSDPCGQRLRERHEECRARGLPGIPREELLGYLEESAEALDALSRQHGLQHLGLNPHTLLVQDGRLRVADFGLVELVWLPTGQPAAPLNARYAAPELQGPGSGPGCDQYSLALVYAEMLTGVHPRSGRAGARAAASGAGKVDLFFLPAADRDAIARALDNDPSRRFTSCTDLVRCLQGPQAGPAAGAAPAAQDLPLVIPVASLCGEPPPPGITLPSLGGLLAELIKTTPNAAEVRTCGDFRYLEHAGHVLESTCLLGLHPSLLPLKLDGFRQQWKAQQVRADAQGFVFHITTAPSFWQRCLGRQTGLEIQVQLPSGVTESGEPFPITLRVDLFGPTGTPAAQNLWEMGPLLLQSLRACLQLDRDRRAHERWPCAAALRVHPILPGLELAEVIEGKAKDVGPGGIGLLVPQRPPTDRVYLHLGAPPLDAFALLARIVRVRPVEGGLYEVGATFKKGGA